MQVSLPTNVLFLLIDVLYNLQYLASADYDFIPGFYQHLCLDMPVRWLSNEV